MDEYLDYRGTKQDSFDESKLTKTLELRRRKRRAKSSLALKSGRRMHLKQKQLEYKRQRMLGIENDEIREKSQRHRNGRIRYKPSKSRGKENYGGRRMVFNVNTALRDLDLKDSFLRKSLPKKKYY